MLEVRRVIRKTHKFCVQKIVLVGWGSKKAHKAEQGQNTDRRVQEEVQL